jgi:deoxyadenosine/deoxycytidine kinase
MNQNNNIQIISIEGNIGSGKSTLLENLKIYYKDNKNVIFLKEPVDEWSKITDENGVTILEKFYADQKKYSFSFQMMAYISRLKLLRDTLNEIKNSEKNYIIITERSLYTDKMVFAKMLYDTDKIEHINYQIYLNWFNTFAEEFPLNKIIYVNTSPENCHNRINKRSRDGEDNIPLEYLESCHNYHENMLNKNLLECVCQSQLFLNGNHDIYIDKHILYYWITLINNFIFN